MMVFVMVVFNVFGDVVVFVVVIGVVVVVVVVVVVEGKRERSVVEL
jgi:hypothetical protein